MRSRFVVTLGLTTLAVSAPPALVAQQPSTYTFYVVGTDTILSERVTRSASGAEGDMVVRAQGDIRIHFKLTADASGAARRLENAVYRSPSDTTALSRASLDFRGDSVIVDIAGGQTQRIGSRAGAVPWINPSPTMLEQILRRAKGIGGAEATVSLFQVAGGATSEVQVAWLGADSATVQMGPVQFRAAVSPDGGLLGAVVPAQGVRITRVGGLRKASVVKPDYSAPADAPYTAEEVIVKTPSGLTLAGTLTLPKQRFARGAPAVVTITGSGPENRDEEIGIAGYRPFRQIADTLGRRGIAVLRLDDRGVGGSEAGSPGATSADFAEDIRAALAYLRTRPEIDKTRLGLVGHSEGGLIAPLVASTEPSLKGIVLLAGPAYSGRRILEYQNRYGAEHMANLPKDKVDSVMQQAMHMIDSVSKVPGWLSYFIAYDPIPTAKKVKVPTLVLQGGTDMQVTPEQAELLAAAIRSGGNRDVTVRVFPQTNHLFLTDPDGNAANYAKLPSKSVRPDVLGAVADWLSQKLR